MVTKAPLLFNETRSAVDNDQRLVLFLKRLDELGTDYAV
jgi:hypothetical protein